MIQYLTGPQAPRGKYWVHFCISVQGPRLPTGAWSSPCLLQVVRAAMAGGSRDGREFGERGDVYNMTESLRYPPETLTTSL